MGGQSAPATTTVTQTNKADPWSGAQPYISSALSDFSGRLNDGWGAPTYYSGQTVAPFSFATNAGMSSLINNYNQGGSQALAQSGTAALNPLLSPTPIAGTNFQSGVASGQDPNALTGAVLGAGYTPTNTGALNYYTGGGQNGFENVLGGMATSSASNPYLTQTFNQGAYDIKNALDSSFASAGRTVDNGNYADAFTRNLGQFAAPLFSNAYTTDQANRLTAAQSGGQLQSAANALGEGAANSLAGYSSSDLARALTAATTGAGLNNTDLSNALAAYNGLTDTSAKQGALSLGAVSDLPSMFTLQNAGAQNMLGVGNMIDQQTQAQDNSNMTAWNFNQQSPYAMYAQLAQLAEGTGGGNSVGTQQVPYSPGNPFAGALGGAAAGASIGSVIPGVGTLLGAGLGGLLGLF